MTPRDLYFATYHQAAHVVTALVLGCRVDFADIGAQSNLVGWNTDSASLTDIDTIYAAGFEMEKVLGRMHDTAWDRSKDDRLALGVSHADRTGVTLTRSEIDAFFLTGAASSQAILQHKVARLAIDELAEVLGDASLRGDTRVLAKSMESITAPITGFAMKNQLV